MTWTDPTANDPAGQVIALVKLLRGVVWIYLYPPVGLGVAIRNVLTRTAAVSSVGRWLLYLSATLFMDLVWLAGSLNVEPQDPITGFAILLVVPAVQVAGFAWGLAGRPRPHRRRATAH